MATTSICQNCGYQGKPRNRTKGSIFIEILLWVLFILPGIVYSIWRLTTREEVCPQCKQALTMLPIDSPRGQQIVESFSKKP